MQTKLISFCHPDINFTNRMLLTTKYKAITHYRDHRLVKRFQLASRGSSRFYSTLYFLAFRGTFDLRCTFLTVIFFVKFLLQYTYRVCII